ncbi:hypothetical protein J2T20_004661 [Paenibacillus wynnii]|nr:hypothetical protein [Paenibacillus wynnii]
MNGMIGLIRYDEHDGLDEYDEHDRVGTLVERIG